mgnify:CR=1 FL=1
MKEMFDILMNQIGANTTAKTEKIDFEGMDEEEQNEKENLERVLQKYQAEIRTHIRTQKELQKLVLELNSQAQAQVACLKEKSDLADRLQRDLESALKRNEDLDQANHSLTKYLDAILLSQKTSLNMFTPGKRSASKNNKPKQDSPHSPAPNKILRSFHAINQLNCNTPGGANHGGTVPVGFTKSFLNKTLRPQSKRQQSQMGSQCSMHDVHNKSIANCMINNLYFIPKTLKT